MRILAVTIFLLAAGAAPAGAVPLVRASTPVCDVPGRTATFQADMRTRPGADRMQVRFVLLAVAEGRWARVKAPGFGEWQTSDPGVGRYVYSKTVESLAVPGGYRARVVFRWLDAEGEPVGRRRRRTPACRMPDPRPDLRAVDVRAHRDGWAVVVRNGGRSDAGAFDVAAVTGGASRTPRRVAGLGARDEIVVPFDGPCGTSVRVTVDAGDAVDERDEDDNVLEAPCPALR